MGYGNVNVSIDLYRLGHNQLESYSGYLTKGDNASTNTRFDQTSGIYDNRLVQYEIIKSVAMVEIPWIGSIKLMANGNGSNVPSNSITDLIISVLALIAIIVAISVLTNFLSKKMREKSKEDE